MEKKKKPERPKKNGQGLAVPSALQSRVLSLRGLLLNAASQVFPPYRF